MTFLIGESSLATLKSELHITGTLSNTKEMKDVETNRGKHEVKKRALALYLDHVHCDPTDFTQSPIMTMSTVTKIFYAESPIITVATVTQYSQFLHRVIKIIRFYKGKEWPEFPTCSIIFAYKKRYTESE